MLAGAEAYDIDNNRLFHTNNYQERVEDFIDFLKRNHLRKPQPEIWITAGNYKIYNEFPNPGALFGKEFFVDHYDKVDAYNFDDLGVLVKLISDDTDATNKMQEKRTNSIPNLSPPTESQTN